MNWTISNLTGTSTRLSKLSSSTPGDKNVQEKSLGLFGVIAVPHLHVQGAAVGCAGFVAESGNDCALLNTAPPF